jgi:uncharacterized protein
MQSEILAKVREFATTTLSRRLPPNLYFHNLTHTLEVVAAAEEIGKGSDLSPAELETVSLAAWFHDLGYSNKYLDHETESAKIAADFLNNSGLEEDKIKAIIDCIMATKYPQQPSSLLQKVICDADFYHFSRKDYPRHEQSLKKEWEAKLNLIYTDREWNTLNFKMLQNHSYWTPYGKTVLQRKKEENIKRLGSNE